MSPRGPGNCGDVFSLHPHPGMVAAPNLRSGGSCASARSVVVDPSVGRRRLPFENGKLTQATVDLRSPAAFDGLGAPDVAFCCLGTTIKKAGSRAAFRAVDHDAVLAFARAAHRQGARVFLHVSAVGADPRSRVFYNSVKGEVEEAVGRVGFGSVHALRPSLLDGERQESRPSEHLGLLVARALGPLLGKYRPTQVAAVAGAMLAFARAPAPGSHIVTADAIRDARRLEP